MGGLVEVGESREAGRAGPIGIHMSMHAAFVHSAGTGVLAVSASSQTLGSMTHFMDAAYVAAYATARSALAALADQADGGDSFRYERALLCLDVIHDGVFPSTYPIVGTRRDLMLWLEGAIEQMIVLDGDGLALELLLGDALNL